MKYKFIGTEKDLIDNGFSFGESEGGGYFERNNYPNIGYTAIYFYDNNEIEADDVNYFQDLIDKGLVVENE